MTYEIQHQLGPSPWRGRIEDMLGQLRQTVIEEKHKLWARDRSAVRRAVGVGVVTQDPRLTRRREPSKAKTDARLPDKPRQGDLGMYSLDRLR